MKVVVTGGSGHLGALVLERLAASPEVERILSLDLVPPRTASSKLEYRIADLREAGIARHLEGADALVHLAFVVTKRASHSERHTANVEGSRRVFEAAASSRIARIVYASSVAAYGLVPGHPVPILETNERRRTGYMPYADEKYAVEEYLDEFEARYPGITVMRLRPGIFLGRRLLYPSAGFVRFRALPFIGDARRPFVWDEDVADAVVLALSRGASGAYNLTADSPLPTEQMARLAGFRPLRIPDRTVNVLGAASSAFKGVLPSSDPSWLRAARVELVASSEKARTELGWTPRYPTVADVAVAFGKHAPRVTDPRITLFTLLVNRFARHSRRVKIMGAPLLSSRIHLDLVGPAGGDFDLSLREGRCRMHRGIARPPDATVSIGVPAFLALLAGEDEIDAAITQGRIRVQGAKHGVSILRILLEHFSDVATTKGLTGRIARRLQLSCSAAVT